MERGQAAAAIRLQQESLRKPGVSELLRVFRVYASWCCMAGDAAVKTIRGEAP